MVLHVGKWLFAEFLRIAWKQDRNVIAQVIDRIVQLEHSLIHELDGKPLVLAKGIPAPEEVLLLLNHATGNRLPRSAIREQAANQKSATVNAAIVRLIKTKEVRQAEGDEIALTPRGQVRIPQRDHSAVGSLQVSSYLRQRRQMRFASARLRAARRN